MIQVEPSFVFSLLEVDGKFRYRVNRILLPSSPYHTLGLSSCLAGVDPRAVGMYRYRAVLEAPSVLGP